MFCKNCGAQISEGATSCSACGTAVTPAPQTSIPTPPKAPIPQVTIPKPASTYTIPAEYKPLSPWAYFGLNILFSIPVIGFIFLLVFTFSGANINRRNYARSFWCYLLVAVIVAIVFLVLYLIMGAALIGGVSAGNAYYY